MIISNFVLFLISHCPLFSAQHLNLCIDRLTKQPMAFRPSPNKKTAQISFVFGSSTPRELSHHLNDCAKKGLKAKLDKEGGKEQHHQGDILYYMRQAKSIDVKAESRYGGGRSRAVAYAFGSSTPRSLSHMSKVPREQRVYDAKLAKERANGCAANGGVRTSATNPQLSTNRSKKWVGGRSVSTESRIEGDEAASEPDIVQDRMAEFTRRQGTPKKDSTTTKPKTKHSTAVGASVPPNIQKKISSAKQQQQQQQNFMSRFLNRRVKEYATEAAAGAEHCQVQAVQQQPNSMRLMVMNSRSNKNNDEEELEEVKEENGNDEVGRGQNEEKNGRQKGEEEENE